MKAEKPEKIFSERFSELVENSNYTLEQIGEYIGIKSKSTISKYLSGDIKNVKSSIISNIANLFNVSPAWLAGLSNEKYRETKLDKLGNPVVSIPLLGVVKAGYDYLAQENWIGSVDIDRNIANSGKYFALKVHGDSMSPVLIEDDIVIIKKQNDFENGDIVVAIINGNEATIKKGKKTNSSITLQPLNTAYDPLVFTYDEVKSMPVTIVGVVKQLKREF